MCCCQQPLHVFAKRPSEVKRYSTGNSDAHNRISRNDCSAPLPRQRCSARTDMQIFLYPSHCTPDPTLYFFFFSTFFFGRVCRIGRPDGSLGCSVTGSSGIGLPRKGAPVRGGGG